MSVVRRHATWLELFFDLVFVLAVASLGALLHANLNTDGFLLFALLFVPVWWVWTGFSYFADLFEPVDGLGSLPYRLIMFLVMLDSIVLAVAVRTADTPAGSALFALTYAALRLLLVALYVQAARQFAQARDFALRHVAGFGAGALLWLLSLAVPTPARYAIWAVALLIELGTPLWAYLTTSSIPVQHSHMPERFGLFTLIVLGDAIVVVGTGVTETGWAWSSLLTATLGFVIAVCIWWLYFSRINDEAITRAAASGRWQTILLSFAYGYGHLLIYAGITAASVGIAIAIEAADHPLASGGRAALCGGLAAALLGITISQSATVPRLPGRVRMARLMAAASFVAIGVVGGSAASPLLIAAIAAVLAALLCWESARPASL